VLDTPTGKVSLDKNRNAIADNFLTEVSKNADGTLYNKLIKVIPQVNQTLGINLTLKPGSLQQRVEVAAEVPPLQTETATLGNVVNGQQVQTLPLNGRNFMDLASLTAGTTPARSDRLG